MISCRLVSLIIYTGGAYRPSYRTGISAPLPVSRSGYRADAGSHRARCSRASYSDGIRLAEAAREADRAEAEAWSIQMEGYGGPSQPSPTTGQCLNGGYGWLEAYREARSGVEMPVMQEAAIRSARAYD